MGCGEFFCNVPCGVLLDELFKYDSIKMVRVENYCVGMFYRTLQLLIMGIFAAQLAYYHSYMSYETPTAAVNGWLDTPGSWRGGSAGGSFADLPYCATDGSTDFVSAPCDARGAPDASATWEYADNSCRAFSKAEISTEESMQFFVATYIQDSIAVVGGGAVPADIEASLGGNLGGSFFVPAAEELFFAFEHAFTSAGFEPTRNIQATVIGHDGDEFQTFDAGQSVRMTLERWLQAAGGISLDQLNEGALQDCDTNGAAATYRLTGVDMVVQLEYANDSPGFGKLGKAHEEQFVELLIRPRLTKVAWGSGGSVWEWIQHPTVGRQREPKGVRFRFEVIGRIGALDYKHLINTVVAGLVFMGLASGVANVVCFYLLGDSDLYKGIRHDTVRRRKGRMVTEEERHVIDGIFERADANHDGEVTMEEFGKAIRTMGTHLENWQVRRLYKRLAGKSFCLLCRRTPKAVGKEQFITWWVRTHDSTKEKLGDVLQLLGSASVAADVVNEDDIENDPELKGLKMVDTGDGGGTAGMAAPPPHSGPPGSAPYLAPAPTTEPPVKCVVTVPMGVYPGQAMTVNVQTRYGPQQVQCVVPPGVMAGGRFIVSVRPEPRQAPPPGALSAWGA